MQIAGIIAEYNPFHSGHAYHIAQTRAAGATHIVAVMSPNFVQRGDIAFAEKRLRAHAALCGGADLVLELPLSHAVAGAQRFARGAVGLLEALGCVDTLSFGCECGSLPLLLQAVSVQEDPAFRHRLQQLLDAGSTFAAARQRALEESGWPQAAAVLARPNDTLAVEYLAALHALHSRIEPLAVARIGASHDSAVPTGGFAAASLLRTVAAAEGVGALHPYLPAEAATLLHTAEAEGLLPASLQRLEPAILSRLRGISDFSFLPDRSEGIEHRLAAAVRKATSLEDLYTQVKCKRYTHARVRRLVLSAFLGIEEALAAQPAPYLHILGCNARGREILSAAHCTLPISPSLAKLERENPACARFAALEAAATDQFMLALPRPQPCGLDYTASAVFLD